MDIHKSASVQSPDKQRLAIEERLKLIRARRRLLQLQNPIPTQEISIEIAQYDVEEAELEPQLRRLIEEYSDQRAASSCALNLGMEMTQNRSPEPQSLPSWNGYPTVSLGLTDTSTRISEATTDLYGNNCDTENTSAILHEFLTSDLFDYDEVLGESHELLPDSGFIQFDQRNSFTSNPTRITGQYNGLSSSSGLDKSSSFSHSNFSTSSHRTDLAHEQNQIHVQLLDCVFAGSDRPGVEAMDVRPRIADFGNEINHTSDPYLVQSGSPNSSNSNAVDNRLVCPDPTTISHHRVSSLKRKHSPIPGTSCFYSRVPPKRLRRGNTEEEQRAINRLRLKGACIRCRRLRLKVRGVRPIAISREC